MHECLVTLQLWRELGQHSGCHGNPEIENLCNNQTQVAKSRLCEAMCGSFARRSCFTAGS